MAQQRYVVGQAVDDGLQSLAQQEKNDPVQANGTTHNDTNIHLTPGRETDHLYQLTEGTKVAILKRSTVEKNSALPAKPAVQPAKPGAPAVPMEDWSLIRDPQGRVGWVSRPDDRFVDLPMEVSQYAEGQRVVAYFALNEVTDGDKKIPQYLVALTEPKDGMQFDYNQIRVFTWTLRKHRYETAYREHGLTAIMAVGIFFLSEVTVHSTQLFQVTASLVIVGAGLGITFLYLNAMQSAVEKKFLGVVSSNLQFFRNMGGTLATAIFGSILANRLGPNIQDQDLFRH